MTSCPPGPKGSVDKCCPSVGLSEVSSARIHGTCQTPHLHTVTWWLVRNWAASQVEVSCEARVTSRFCYWLRCALSLEKLLCQLILSDTLALACQLAFPRGQSELVCTSLHTPPHTHTYPVPEVSQRECGPSRSGREPHSGILLPVDGC